MSSITVIQGGTILGATMAIGARCFPSFDGDTASYAWTLTAVPPSSAAVMGDAGTGAPFFDPDIYGLYEGSLTDSFANVFTFSISAPPPFTGDAIREVHDEAALGVVDYLPDTIGEVGHRRAIMGQNTDALHAGGEVEIAAGVGLTSRGVVLSERVLGSTTATVPIVRLTEGECVFEGSSSFAMKLRFDSTPVSLAQFLGSTATGFLHDAGTEHRFRVSDGATMGALERLKLDRTGVGFFGAAPVAQATRPGQLTDSTGGAVDGTLVDVGLVFSQGNINNNFADVADRLNKLEAIVAALGFAA